MKQSKHLLAILNEIQILEAHKKNKKLVHLTGISHIRQSTAWYLLLHKIVSSYIFFFFPETFSDNLVHYEQNAHNYVAYFINLIAEA